MLLLWLVQALVVLQAAGVPAPAPAGDNDFFLPAERARYGQETRIDGKIEVYEKSSARYHATVAAQVKKEDFSDLEANLAAWRRLLEASLIDVEAGVQPGKKSKRLIKYEIQLRKAIADLQGFKTTAGVEQFDLFNTWLVRAEQIRTRFVDILFKR